MTGLTTHSLRLPTLLTNRPIAMVTSRNTHAQLKAAQQRSLAYGESTTQSGRITHKDSK